ncbi:hypothetical protein CK203_059026 [Vitis vinifera]|uniref:Uncharacterized protein n=1 Tax=Vitis vinifera TaxID=29760 RepID=A0A438GCT2_VITVI|nr:hypothetical protein CK203_059026 [Vitis vinifera]
MGTRVLEKGRFSALEGGRSDSGGVERVDDGVRMGCPDAPSDGFVSHGRRDKSVDLLLGGGRAIITHRAADRDRGRCRGCQRSWEVTCCHFIPVLSLCRICRSSRCDICECRVLLPEEVRIGEARHVYPWGNPDWGFSASNIRVVTVIAVWFSTLFFQFTLGTIQYWAPVPSPVSVQGIPSLHTDPTSLHPPQHSPGADGMQRSQSAFQLGPLPAGGAKGHVLVRGAWAGLLGHPDRPFSPNHSLVLPSKAVCWFCPAFILLYCLGGLSSGLTSLFADTAGPDKRGRAVEWGVPRVYRQYSPQEAAKEGSAWGALHLKDLTFYKEAPGKKCCAASLPGEAPAKKKNKRKLVLHNKGKEIKLPTPPKELVIPLSTYVKEVTIRESEHPVPPSISSGPGNLAGLNHSGPSMSVAGRLALLAEEATLINQPGSPHPDRDTAEASCAAALPPTTSPMKEMGAESQSLPPCGPNPLPLYRCSSVQDDHPEESEAEMAAENPPAPVVVPDGDSPGATQPVEIDGAPELEEEPLSNASSGGNPVDDAVCISASAFSYAELEEKLKRIPPDSDVVMPLAKMFEVVETV